MKKYIAVAGVVSILILGVGCSSNVSNTSNTQSGGTSTAGDQPVTNPVFNDTKDVVFSDINTDVAFHYLSYLKPTDVVILPGAVSFKLVKRPGSTAGLLDNILFSTKGRDAWAAELMAVKPKSPGIICDDEMQYGCEKWDEKYQLYIKALKTNDFSGYYAMGAGKMVINGITYIVTVTYNMENQQYQTTYTAYVDNTRITFVDPASGGIEYGIPFSMDAKNREMVETIAKNLASRKRVDDVKMRARADELFYMVSTVVMTK
jgi:hypothetical protein